MTSPKTGKGTFKVIWELKNFSYATQRERECLSSPTFIIDTPMKTKWHLELYPRGQTDNLSISCLFKREEFDECPYNIFMTCQFSVLDKHNQQHNIVQKDGQAVGRQNIVGVKHLINRDYILQNKDTFLPQDTLTICFYVSDIVVTRSVQCEINTLFGIEKRSFLWTIDNFKQHERSGQWQIEIPSVSDVRFTLKMIFVSKRKSERNKIAQIGIKSNNRSPIFLVCEISSIDMDGKSQVLAFDKHLFCNNEFWVLCQFNELSELFVSENIFQKNGALHLRCIATISDGVKMNHIVSSCCDQYFPKNENQV